MQKINKDSLLKMANQDTIFVCYEGRLTEYIVPKQTKQELFNPDIEKRLNTLTIYVNGMQADIDLNYRTKSNNYRTGLILNQNKLSQKSVVEILPSIEILLRHVKIQKEATRELLTNLTSDDASIQNESLLKLNKKGMRLLENELVVSDDIKNVISEYYSNEILHIFKNKGFMDKEITVKKMELELRFSHKYDNDNENNLTFGLRIAIRDHAEHWTNVGIAYVKNKVCFVAEFNDSIISNSRDYIIKKNLAKLNEYTNYWESKLTSKQVCVF